jgi:hypothetical protein
MLKLIVMFFIDGRINIMEIALKIMLTNKIFSIIFPQKSLIKKLKTESFARKTAVRLSRSILRVGGS